MKKVCLIGLLNVAILYGCKKGGDTPAPPVDPPATSFLFSAFTINGQFNGYTYYNINSMPVLRFSFAAPIDANAAGSHLSFTSIAGAAIAYTVTYEAGDSALVLRPTSSLNYLSRYKVSVATGLKSKSGGSLLSGVDVNFTTGIDSSRKFPALSDNDLFDTIQRRTFRYFWDFAHPVSGLARERSNGDNSIVTTGGSGFGIMAIVTAVHRGFITRAQGLARLQTIVGFLKNTAVKVKGAFPHWMNGSTGAIIPFDPQDNGADLVETSYLLQGLLTARQFFDGGDGTETTLRDDINTIWNNVDWDWFRQGAQQVLYWHYSPTLAWVKNVQVKGWNECLITYLLAASSPTHAVPKTVYDNGWASNGNMQNGATYYNYKLSLGPALGGPLFFSHYSFLGVNPNGLADAYADYALQTKNHTLINYSYCKANPKNYFGYSDSVWGLTASDIRDGYNANSPSNDVGVISPTAALSSLPYTPVESMAALKYFYYVLGDRIWKEYGFVDAFSLQDIWFADSFLAIDQGPIIIMIENYRSKLLWNLFTSCPEIKTGMQALGFTAPYL